MRFLVDTNILLYAANTACDEHLRAREFLRGHLAEETPFCLTPGVIYEFLRVATHARVFPKPLRASQATQFLRPLVEREETTVLAPTARHWSVLERTLAEVKHASGNLFHDIATAVLMREYGVQEIITADTDYLQFRFLRVTNPLA